MVLGDSGLCFGRALRFMLVGYRWGWVCCLGFRVWVCLGWVCCLGIS